MFRKERQVHFVHNLVIVRLRKTPVLLTPEKFKQYCDECFQNDVRKSSEFRMAVLANTAFSAKLVPNLEREFKQFIERVAIEKYGDLFQEHEYFGKPARRYLDDFIEVNRWFYQNYSYSLQKLDGRDNKLLTVTTYKKTIIPLPLILRRKIRLWRFLYTDIECLIGGWWDFRFCVNGENWFRVRKGEMTLDPDFNLLP